MDHGKCFCIIHTGDHYVDSNRLVRLDFGTEGHHLHEGHVNSTDLTDGAADSCFNSRTHVNSDRRATEHGILRQGTGRRNNMDGEAINVGIADSIAVAGEDSIKRHILEDRSFRCDICIVIIPAVKLGIGNNGRESADGSTGSDLAGFNRLAVGNKGDCHNIKGCCESHVGGYEGFSGDNCVTVLPCSSYACLIGILGQIANGFALGNRTGFYFGFTIHEGDGISDCFGLSGADEDIGAKRDIGEVKTTDDVAGVRSKSTLKHLSTVCTVNTDQGERLAFISLQRLIEAQIDFDVTPIGLPSLCRYAEGECSDSTIGHALCCGHGCKCCIFICVDICPGCCCSGITREGTTTEAERTSGSGKLNRTDGSIAAERFAAAGNMVRNQLHVAAVGCECLTGCTDIVTLCCTPTDDIFICLGKIRECNRCAGSDQHFLAVTDNNGGDVRTGKSTGRNVIAILAGDFLCGRDLFRKGRDRQHLERHQKGEGKCERTFEFHG